MPSEAATEDPDLAEARPHTFHQRVTKARRGLDPDERRRVMDAVALRREDGWFVRFGVMMALSVVVAVMGLSAGSAAIVIGAMLLAPLMTPVMGTAAALAMGLPRHVVRFLNVVGIASVVAIALSFLLASVLPEGPLSGEVLSRTSPDLRDLMVALAAGAAGAYAILRPDVSSALPGVAVAVALVPPLATIGVALEAGRGELASGATLLYVANLLAIILVGTLVFLVTGFVPGRRLRDKGAHVFGGWIVVALATIVVAVPLALASIAAADAGQDREQIHDAATGWLQGTGDDLDEVRVDDLLVRIRISGPNPPPDTTELDRAVAQVLGPSSTLEVRWTQTQEPPETDPGPAPAEVESERRLAAVRQVVDGWLVAGGTDAYEVDEVDVGVDRVRVDLTSAEPPPGVDALSTRLHDELDLLLPVVVNWTQRTTLHAGGSGRGSTPATIDQVRRQLEAVAQEWARSQPDLVAESVAYDGRRVTVELAGAEAVDAADLEARVREIAGAEAVVRIWFTERRLLSASSTTSPGA